MNDSMKNLQSLRMKTQYASQVSDPRATRGLSDSDLQVFRGTELESQLNLAIDRSIKELEQVESHLGPSFIAMPEWEQIEMLQEGMINFYALPTRNPYVPLAAQGPWIVTSKGAIVHDSGGYGMLGHGHAPQLIIDVMQQPHVMANIMTAHTTQKLFIEAMRTEIGSTRHNRQDLHHQFVCLNSGSESMSLALRVVDVHALDLHKAAQDRKPMYIVFRRGFHGRTDGPARLSDSSRPGYFKNLLSFQEQPYVSLCPNDIHHLEMTFDRLHRSGYFVPAILMEPVQGEGNPGQALSPAFYKRAGELCKQYNSLLIIDSIQAGYRCSGYLSVVDYPGFRDLPAPDMESFSKAINGGQYPLSVLAMSKRAAGLYRKGIYGNTMTAAPRALAIGTAVLQSFDPALRAQIEAAGKYFLDKLKDLKRRYRGLVLTAQGTGLLLACEIHPDRAQVVGDFGIEQNLRRSGIGVIHGGENAIRFTPHFRLTHAEIDLMFSKIYQELDRL